MASVQLHEVTKHFGDFVAIRHVDLHVAAGEFVTLLGPSGCGKTTTLRCVAGLEEPSSGAISIDETVVSHPQAKRSVPTNKRDIGMVFQSYALWPHMNVFDNVAFPLRRARLDQATIDRRVARIIEAVGLSPKLHSPVSDLSGGQQQRVSLARALVRSPKVMLYDEPLSNLDASLRRVMRTEIRRLHDEMETTAIYVTHDQEEAISLSDRIAVLQDGLISQIGSPRDIFAAPRNEFIARFIGIENVLTLTESTRDDRGVVTCDLGDGFSLLANARDEIAGKPKALGFRAEDVRLSSDSGDLNCFSGEVESCLYLGRSLEITVRIGSQRIAVRLSVHDDEAVPAVGAIATFCVDPRQVLTLAAA